MWLDSFTDSYKKKKKKKIPLRIALGWTFVSLMNYTSFQLFCCPYVQQYNDITMKFQVMVVNVIIFVITKILSNKKFSIQAWKSGTTHLHLGDVYGKRT